MPKIDFYIMGEGGTRDRLLFICRIIEKAHQQRHRIYINTDTQMEAHQLDERLWTYREDSFLPHNLYGEGPEPAPPIQIGFSVVPAKQRDILINLSKEIPAFFTQFQRVLEVVGHEPDSQTISRAHFRQYRSQGFDINTHKLQTVE